MFESLYLMEVVTRIFSIRGYDRTLEDFIASRNPQNTAEVDNLIVEYQRKSSGGLI